MLELIGEAELAEGLAEYVRSKDAVPIPLSSAQPHKGVRQDMRWRDGPVQVASLAGTRREHRQSSDGSVIGDLLQHGTAIKQRRLHLMAQPYQYP